MLSSIISRFVSQSLMLHTNGEGEWIGSAGGGEGSELRMTTELLKRMKLDLDSSSRGII